MLSYPLPEAETLLQSKFDAAKSSLANCEEDLDFLREQITVSQGRVRTIGSKANHVADHGSGYSTSLQLGCQRAKKGKEKRRRFERRQ